MFNCDNTYRDFISNCSDTIDVNVTLTPETSYDVIITDKFQNQYKKTYTTDENGYLQLDVNDFPDGFFNQYAGDFKLEVFTNDCQRESLEITDSEGNVNNYDSITFNVIGGTREKTALGCVVGVYD